LLLLNKDGLNYPTDWQKAGVLLPLFDIEHITDATLTAPQWVHFGAGNIFRGYIARISQTLLNKNLYHSGIIAADTFDGEIIERVCRPHDNFSLLVELHADGTTTREIISSIVKALCLDGTSAGDEADMRAIFESPSLQLASFTITEKGYSLNDINGDLLPAVRSEIERGPEVARHAMSVVCALMLHRYKSGGAPMALVSMDNCSRNGELLQTSVMSIARGWVKNGFADEGLIYYLCDPDRVSFPWSMIDKITPRPAQSILEQLTEMGIAGLEPITTSKGTFIAPFVNAEVTQYLIIEDKFPNGRPPFNLAGVFMTDRETVNRTERMKVMTCLNPLHTAMAVFGCLLGYQSIADEIRDPGIKLLVERIGKVEGLPVVVDPGIISPEAFLEEVLTERLPNPFIPDTPQRIVTDTSQKIPIRFGHTINAYADNPDLDLNSLTGIPLAIAGWLRYLLGVDDSGNPMQLRPDPLLEYLKTQLAGIAFDDPDSCPAGRLDEILSNDALFSIDLCECGLSGKIEQMFRSMLGGSGAVRATLKYYSDDETAKV
jgi:fructuronate reductase